MELLKTMRILERMERALNTLSFSSAALISFPEAWKEDESFRNLTNPLQTLKCYGELIEVEADLERVAHEKDDDNEHQHLGYSYISPLKFLQIHQSFKMATVLVWNM